MLPILLLSTAVAIVLVPNSLDPSFNRGSGGACEANLSLVHVQDNTGAFQWLRHLQSDFSTTWNALEGMFSRVRYGQSLFGDKAAPISGYGVGWSMWTSEFGNVVKHSDECYRLSVPLGHPPADMWSSVKPSGGKDADENQWDALGRAVLDPTHWSELPREDELRIALLVVSGFGHVSAAAEHRSSFTAVQTWYRSNFGSLAEEQDWAIVSSDMDGAYLSVPLGQKGRDIRLRASSVYQLFTVCHDHMETDRNTRGWRRMLIRDLHRRGVDTDGAATDRQISRWFMDLCRREMIQEDGLYQGIFKFANNIAPVSTFNIGPYPYSDVFDHHDCTSFEYPDPTSRAYAEMFLTNGVAPVILALPLSAGSYGLTFLALEALDTHCPVLKASCGQYAWLCIRSLNDKEVEEIYGKCLDEHYNNALKALNAHGVPAAYIRNSNQPGKTTLGLVDAVSRLREVACQEKSRDVHHLQPTPSEDGRRVPQGADDVTDDAFLSRTDEESVLDNHLGMNVTVEFPPIASGPGQMTRTPFIASETTSTSLPSTSLPSTSLTSTSLTSTSLPSTSFIASETASTSLTASEVTENAFASEVTKTASVASKAGLAETVAFQVISGRVGGDHAVLTYAAGGAVAMEGPKSEGLDRGTSQTILVWSLGVLLIVIFGFIVSWCVCIGKEARRRRNTIIR
ncbi:MAG: hypothetical protein KVP17_000926 [Porospora cf. gigantea B]|uniref:uncharacterized protein n=1 Tax=Porospora cf. gigantea B TaxID=2853592 RepID=UPI003571E385|nr:MAG: hypothetical protein KVP17_000926 [Porospora cf. gigantea B]